MGARTADRRALIAGMAALGAAAPSLSRAAIVEVGGSASHMANMPDPTSQDYEPPTRLTAVLDIYKRMTGAVKVAGSGPYPFVADTGANQSVISTELAAQLGLPAGDT
jgi:hypothetical protein